MFLIDTYAGPTLRGAAALDQFGEAIVAGDFNGDGWDDLAVGASWVDAAGLVLILARSTCFWARALAFPRSIWRRNLHP